MHSFCILVRRKKKKAEFGELGAAFPSYNRRALIGYIRLTRSTRPTGRAQRRTDRWPSMHEKSYATRFVGSEPAACQRPGGY